MRAAFAIFSLTLFVTACADKPRFAPKTSAAVVTRWTSPVWVVSPEPEGKSNVAAGVHVNRSNNNLAIALHGNRLYFAFRTATHHHPKPPIWVPELYAKWREATTRLYVMSAPVTADTFRDFEKEIPRLEWRLEFEAKEKAGITKEDDFREPLFISMNGDLHFYFCQVKGEPMKFEPLKNWHVTLPRGGTWSKAEPILGDKEILWEAQVRKELGVDVAYLTSYSGDHYATGAKEPETYVHFRYSSDGKTWMPVGHEYVDKGGASEAAFVFHPRTNDLLSVLRLEDGDWRGWGTVVGKASEETPAEWQVSKSADPLRYDSPRMFADGDDIFMIARQNLAPAKDGKVDESKGFPYDQAFVGRSHEEGLKEREKVLERIRKGQATFRSTSNPLNLGISVRYAMTYHFNQPKRTALYRVDDRSGKIERVEMLPSAGDTGFPSIVALGNGEYLIANYSSPFEKKTWTWNDGQNNRTGIYFIKLKLR